MEEMNKKTIKDRFGEFEEKHPKIAKFGKGLALVAGGAIVGAIGITVAKSRATDAGDQVVDLLETTSDVLDAAESIDE
jgi:uncharacterized protein GlcG (DUF336 family)